MSAVRTKKQSSYLQKPSENPRLPQKSASVQRTSRRALGDLTNRAPKSVQKPKGDATCAKKKSTRVEAEDLDEIETGPPPENDEDQWVEPSYFKALTTILSGSLIKPCDELLPAADIFPEPKMETSRRPPYPLHPGLFPSTSPAIDICDISPFDVDEDFRKYVD